MAHFFPSREGDAVNWLNNVSVRAKLVLQALGLPETLADEPLRLKDQFITDLAAATVARAEYQKSIATKKASKTACVDNACPDCKHESQPAVDGCHEQGVADRLPARCG